MPPKISLLAICRFSRAVFIQTIQELKYLPSLLSRLEDREYGVIFYVQ